MEVVFLSGCRTPFGTFCGALREVTATEFAAYLARAAIERAGMALGEMDLIEVNAAFAAQYLAVEKELCPDRSRVNVNGGAVAIGHPLGASGAPLAVTLLHELRRRGDRFGLAGACVGGGQGMSLVVEALGGEV